MLRRSVLALALTGPACRANPPAVTPEALALPAPALERFGALLEASFPAGQPRTLVPSAFEELSSALRADDPLALRALLLLARCSDPLASELFLQRLERRATPGAE